MAKSYLGGGTLIGFGSRWSDWRDFPNSFQSSKKTKAQITAKVQKVAKRKVAATSSQSISTEQRQFVATSVLRAHRRATQLSIGQKDILKHFGHSKKDLRGRRLGERLKMLVKEGILLETGLPNPDHPTVQALHVQAKQSRPSGA